MGASRVERRLHDRLERLRLRYGASYLGSDPLEFPRRFQNSLDREVAGLVASSLAYGNVKVIRRSVDRVLTSLGRNPGTTAARGGAGDMLRRLDGFRHRWTRARDVACLLTLAGRMIEARGSLGAFFAET